MSVTETQETRRACCATPKQLKFKRITLHGLAKTEYAAFRHRSRPRPNRRAFSIALERGTPKVSEVVVNLTTQQVEPWKDVRNPL